ncbi:hypothetical protein Pint_03588 [Pistacia integerrima]|uniref:Uncharacterized protein n=1 Tax=Pistacia integerrima TaxID=434235 RepID=A0ACC0Z739_9ROSI|nr:hypothetical protein Pint_03588 [Pistacia integerrima]
MEEAKKQPNPPNGIVRAAPIPSLLERIMKSWSDQPLPLSNESESAPASAGPLSKLSSVLRRTLQPSGGRFIIPSSGRYPSIEWGVSRHSDSTVISDIGTDGKDEHFTMIASPPYPAGIELVACPLLLYFLNPLLRGSRFELLGNGTGIPCFIRCSRPERSSSRILTNTDKKRVSAARQGLNYRPQPCHREGTSDRQRIIGTPTTGKVSEPCNRQPFCTVQGALESAAGARLRLDPYPIFGPIPPSYYQKMRFLQNPSLLLQPLPN